jgi:glyoxylate carboligase
VRTLEDRGVEYVFGIPGAKIDAVFDALVDSKIQTVACRHDQNAAFIAGGVGRMTGKAGVCIATPAIGATGCYLGVLIAAMVQRSPAPSHKGPRPLLRVAGTTFAAPSTPDSSACRRRVRPVRVWLRLFHLEFYRRAV